MLLLQVQFQYDWYNIKQCHVFMSSVSDPYGIAPSSGARTACLITLEIFALNQSQITLSQYGYSAINTDLFKAKSYTSVPPSI